MLVISGKVIKGEQYGRTLGFPTANLETSGAKLPPAGVYAGNVIIDGTSYRAGILINPQTDNKSKVEAHVIGYNGDLYGKEITLDVQKFIREYKKFENEQELIAQIKEDIKQCLQA